MRTAAFSTIAALIVALVGAAPAHAYLDPGSGSLVLQLILGGVAGLFVILKLYWHKLLAIFGVGKPELKDTGDSDQESAAP